MTVTPSKPCVAARASRTAVPSIEPARVMASAISLMRVTEGCENRFRRVAVFGLVGRVEGFRDRRLVVDALVGREGNIGRRVPAQLGQERGVVPVTTDDRQVRPRSRACRTIVPISPGLDDIKRKSG